VLGVGPSTTTATAIDRMAHGVLSAGLWQHDSLQSTEPIDWPFRLSPEVIVLENREQGRVGLLYSER
jgi:hypothetical protein